MRIVNGYVFHTISLRFFPDFNTSIRAFRNFFSGKKVISFPPKSGGARRPGELGKTVPSVLSTTLGLRPRAALKTSDTVFPNTDLPAGK